MSDVALGFSVAALAKGVMITLVLEPRGICGGDSLRSSLKNTRPIGASKLRGRSTPASHAGRGAGRCCSIGHYGSGVAYSARPVGCSHRLHVLARAAGEGLRDQGDRSGRTQRWRNKDDAGAKATVWGRKKR